MSQMSKSLLSLESKNEMESVLQELETKLKKVTVDVQKMTAMEKKKNKNITALEEEQHSTEAKQPKRRLPEAIANRILEFPLFDGTDSAVWILKMERFFEYHAMDDFARMIEIIALCMSGQALSWFQSVENRNTPPKSWEAFRRDLFERFEGGDTMYERFIALQQDGSVREYCSQFELYGALLPDIPDSILEAKFMNGLAAVIRAEVRVFQPKCIVEMMETARLVEDKNVALMNLDTSCKAMKLGATIEGRAVVVKVDSEETQNFISRDLAKELKLPVDGFGINGAVLGSGKTVKLEELYRRVLLRIQNLTFVVECLPIEMEGDFEVILGMPWLRAEVDWKALTMKMNLGVNTVTFQCQEC